MAARGKRLVGIAETLIGDGVYHFQSKLTAKAVPGNGIRITAIGTTMVA